MQTITAATWWRSRVTESFPSAREGFLHLPRAAHLGCRNKRPVFDRLVVAHVQGSFFCRFLHAGPNLPATCKPTANFRKMHNFQIGRPNYNRFSP